jgi:hypothetical protein
MRLHPQLVEKLLNYVQNLGGHKDDAKLRAVFLNMDFTPYTRESSGEVILVETAEYLKKLEEAARNK